MLMGVRVRHFGKDGLIIYALNIFQMGSRERLFEVNLSGVFQIQKMRCAKRPPPNAAPVACVQLISSRQQSQRPRTTVKVAPPVAMRVITPHLPCFKQPKYPQNPASKMENATNTFSSFASVKIVPARIGAPARSHGIRMQWIAYSEEEIMPMRSNKVRWPSFEVLLSIACSACMSTKSLILSCYST